MDISFVLPVLNEEDHIVDCIESIRQQMRDKSLTFEFIIVDDASVDRSADYARANIRTQHQSREDGDQKDVLFLLNNKEYPSVVRNIGAGLSRGKVLVFLDADVVVTDQWGDNILDVYKDALNHRMITGSTVSIPDNPTWIETTWFEPATKLARKYINTGHLIVSRKLFTELNKFNESLETGEDTDFSNRAREADIDVVVNQDLKVVHLGYPQTFKAFFKRERWHGRGNFVSKETMKSKMAQVVIATAFYLTLMLVGVIFQTWAIFWIGAFFFFGTAFAFALQRYKTIFTFKLIPATALSSTVFLGRIMAGVDVLKTKLRS